jgi:hypothetical protein
MGQVRLTKVAGVRILAEELETLALKGRAVATVLKESAEDEIQEGLIIILGDLMTDLEELLPMARALRKDPSRLVEPSARQIPRDRSLGGEKERRNG